MNDGGNVYPFEDRVTLVPKSHDAAGVVQTVPVVKKGITRRDWLAGLAMQGLLASGQAIGDVADSKAGTYVTYAYILADTMIEEGCHE